jgi:hypothetical protein
VRRKTMKKRTIALLCLVLVFACVLTACGGGGKKDLSNSKYVGT